MHDRDVSSVIMCSDDDGDECVLLLTMMVSWLRCTVIVFYAMEQCLLLLVCLYALRDLWVWS